MVLRSPLSYLKKQYINKLGYHTKRKILVIESDDWGSIRTPSKEILDKLVKQGDTADQDAFLSNDSIESPSDVALLFDMLRQYKDGRGRHPCITANFAVANPNFEKIKTDMGHYYFESITDTYGRYYGKANGMIDSFLAGRKEHLFVPQLHAREHMNVARWMRDLKAGRPDALLACSYNMIGIGKSFTRDNLFGYMDELNFDSPKELSQIEIMLKEASSMFENLFGYTSKTFVASCFTWSPRIEKTLSEIGVEMIQTQFRQNVFLSKGTTKRLSIYHYTGQKSRSGLYYSIRNCEYEPAYDHNIERRVDSCLHQVQRAFSSHKPAVINSHRLNYIGSINPFNSKMGLDGLSRIISTLLKEYPDIEFMSSDELLREMKRE